MAKQKSVRVNVIPFQAKSPMAAPANVQAAEHGSGHEWLVPHLIMLISYAERHNLSAVESALAIAAEAIVQATRAQEQPTAGASSGKHVVPVATKPTVRSG